MFFYPFIIRNFISWLLFAYLNLWSSKMIKLSQNSKTCNLNHFFKKRGFDIDYSVPKKLDCIIKKDKDKLDDT